MIDIGAAVRGVARFMIHVQDTGLQMTVDPVAGDKILGKYHSFARQIEQPTRVFITDRGFQIILIHTLPGTDLSSISTRRSPSDTVRVQQDNAHPAPCAVQSSRQAGKATANDTDIGTGLSRKRGKRIQRDGARSVIRVRVGARTVIGRQKVHALSRNHHAFGL